MSDRLNATERVEIERHAVGWPLATYDVRAEAERLRAEHMARLIRRAAVWLRARIARLAATYRNARLVRELAALDDRTLADIGLDRNDLAAIAAGEDPRKGAIGAKRREPETGGDKIAA